VTMGVMPLVPDQKAQCSQKHDFLCFIYISRLGVWHNTMKIMILKPPEVSACFGGMEFWPA
jgi:hypothetical protein